MQLLGPLAASQIPSQTGRKNIPCLSSLPLTSYCWAPFLSDPPSLTPTLSPTSSLQLSLEPSPSIASLTFIFSGTLPRSLPPGWKSSSQKGTSWRVSNGSLSPFLELTENDLKLGYSYSS